MTYQDELNKLTRTPVTLVIISLDFCQRSFGVNPCLATGTPCYNTYATCKYKSAWLKGTWDLKISSYNSPLPFRTGERPYLESITWHPTEIKDNLTVKSRVKLVALDEPDTDVGIDPYVTQRSSVQGTFWKKLIARHRNYKSKTVRILEGCIGLAEQDFEERFIGKIDAIAQERGKFTIEVVDLLASLDEIEIPPKLDIKLVVDITDTANAMTLTDVEDLDLPSGYVRIGNEVVYYTGVNAGSNELTGCQRGYLGTLAEEHSANEKVQKCRYYAPANPFDILQEMLLTDAQMDAARVMSTEFDRWRDWPGGEIDFSALISEPTKLSTLYFEIVDLLDCKSWVGEDLQVTIRRNIPNEPGREYKTVTDLENIVVNQGGVDLNEKSRVAKAVLYWDKDIISKVDDRSSYVRIDTGLDPDAISEYGGSTEQAPEKVFLCRWLRAGYLQEEVLEGYISDLLARRVWAYRDAMPIIAFDVELKDSTIKTGDYTKISTDEILEQDGMPLVNQPFIVIKRERRGDDFKLRSLRLPSRRVDIIAPDDAPDWEDATDEDKEYGYICDDDGLMPDGTPGYAIY